MDRIFKFQLAVDDIQDVDMPTGCAVLSVQAQRNVPCIWAMVDPNAPKIRRRFRTYGTGHPMEDAGAFPHYVGTYQLQNGSLVYHVFTDRVERS